MTVKEKVYRLQKLLYPVYGDRRVPPPVYHICRARDAETGEWYYFCTSDVRLLTIEREAERYAFVPGSIEILVSTRDRNRARALAPELR